MACIVGRLRTCPYVDWVTQRNAMNATSFNPQSPSMPAKIRLSSFLLLTVLNGLAHAQTASDVDLNPYNRPDFKSPAALNAADWPALNAKIQSLKASGKTAQALQDLLTQEPLLAGNPEFDYSLGITALELAQYGLAQAALERVILISPNHAGAWLDLAITHFKLGELENAQQIIRHLQDNFDPPAALKQQLAQVSRQLSIANFSRDWQGVFSASQGYVSNPNSGLSNSRFSLTPDIGGPVGVEIDPKMRPQADSATQLRGALYRVFTHQNGAQSTVSAALQVKDYQQQSRYSLIDAALAWQYKLPFSDDKQWSLKLIPSLRYIDQGGDALGYFSSASVGLFKNIQSCELGARLDIEQRTYVQSNYFSASIPWLGAVVACQRGSFLYGASARIGLDISNAARPGGDTQKFEATAYLRGLITDSLSAGLMLYAGEYQDQQGYSPLLDHYQSRRLHRLSQRAEIIWKLPTLKGWGLQADLEHAQDDSNIPTARIDDLQLFLGARYQF